MLSDSVLKKIENGEINSRRKLYKITGRSKKLMAWLNENNFLMPTKWTKEAFVFELNKKGMIVAQEDWNLVRLAKRFYGRWNNALMDVFGEVNQHTYIELTDNDLLDTIKKFVLKYQRLPLREEFDGSSLDRPYFETFTKRFKVSKWSEVLSLISLTKVYFNSSKNSYGKTIIHNGILYFSTQEYLIGKYLEENNILFEKEVPYENCKYIFDFKLLELNAFIEYYGISTKEYKERIELKRKMYDGRKVIEIFKHDNTIKKLALEVQRL